MKNFTRTTLENEAARLGYELSEASAETRMKAASTYERLPRWELNRTGNMYADSIICCETLADVARELDHIEVMASL